MLTLFLRKDIARAQVLADDLDRYRIQLQYTADLGRAHYLDKLGSPRGLLICFGVGCATALLATRHSDSAKSVLGLMKQL